jgi:periplasmic divalent cation tolerance protein
VTNELAIVLVTAPDAEVAEHIVRTLVDERLVACGNIVPAVVSIYRWQDEVQREAEVLIVLKTTRARAADVITRVPALHPYEVPEVLVVPVSDGFAPYVHWVAAGSGSRSED